MNRNDLRDDPEAFRSPRRRRFTVRSLFTIVACSLIACPSAMAQSRGELLYTTHCLACHTTQMHWRDNRAASNWTSLKLQVRRWQLAASLGWSDSDILEVSRYLNESIYHFDETADSVSSSGARDTPSGSAPTRSASHRLP